MDKIVDERTIGKRKQYLVRWGERRARKRTSGSQRNTWKIMKLWTSGWVVRSAP